MPDNPEHPRDRSHDDNTIGDDKPSAEGPGHSKWEEEETRPLDVDSLDEERIETTRLDDLLSGEPIESPTEPLPPEERRDPFDVAEYEIVEPPENEDEDTDAFARIPAGPTEEVDFGEPRPRRSRRARPPRRAPRVRGKEAPPVAAVERPRRIPVAAIVALAIVMVVLVTLIVWVAGRTRNETQSAPELEAPAATEGP